ncbi:MFS transporter [Streptomyces sp. NPDC056910]|uniref:MFS transporter n=1 Tax=Streptomyces sp. NPDC056910 TaxID=3345964 RepID=UPI00368F1269
MLEWYDFFLYTTAAAMVLGSVFFPSEGHPLLGTIAALAGHAVGFAARPIGGLVFGHIGDRRGRKTALMATLSLMGGTTFCRGLLPSYGTAGIISPLLLVLLRVLRGAAAGGEWGGGVLIITENVPADRRGFLASFSSTGMGLGFVLSSLALWPAEQATGDAFLAWGWRLPFLASALIFVVGIYIRRNLGETAGFEAESGESEQRSPLREVLRRHPRQVLFAMALRFADSGASYIFMSFSLVYGAYAGISSTVLLWAGIVGMLVDSVMMVVFGRLSASGWGARRYADPVGPCAAPAPARPGPSSRAASSRRTSPSCSALRPGTPGWGWATSSTRPWPEVCLRWSRRRCSRPRDTSRPLDDVRPCSPNCLVTYGPCRPPRRCVPSRARCS